MSDSTILITGANRGIGLSLAERFAADGWQVLACCRDPSAASALRAVQESHDGLEIYALDVTDYARMRELAEELAEQPIDILLSNAGIYGPRGLGFGTVEPEAWLEVLEVNTVAPLMLAQAFVEQVAASRQKLVAMVSSKMGSIADNGSGGSYIYRTSKTALNQVVRSLSIDLAERGISVITLHPGWVRTDMGGPNAEITTAECVAGLRPILQSAGPAQSGRFIEYDGSLIPW